MPLLRSHLYFPVVDNHGDVLSDLQVRFYEPHTTVLIEETVYALSAGNSELSQPITYSNGVIDAYLAYPKRVTVGIEPQGQAEFFLHDQEFRPAGDNAVLSTGGVIVVQGAPSAADQAILSNGDGTARWGAVSTTGGGGGDGGYGGYGGPPLLLDAAGKGMGIESSGLWSGFNNAGGSYASRYFNHADVDFFYDANDADAGLSWVDIGGGVGAWEISEDGLYSFVMSASLQGVTEGDKFTCYASIFTQTSHANDLGIFARQGVNLTPRGDGTWDAAISFVSAGPWRLPPGDDVTLQLYLYSRDPSADCGDPEIDYWYSGAWRVG